MRARSIANTHSSAPPTTRRTYCRPILSQRSRWLARPAAVVATPSREATRPRTTPPVPSATFTTSRLRTRAAAGHAVRMVGRVRVRVRDEDAVAVVHRALPPALEHDRHARLEQRGRL